MTTIAFDGKVLAADTQYTSGDFVSGYANKIHNLNDGSYLAMSGQIDYVPVFIAWLNGGDKPELPADAQFTAAHFKDGNITEYSSSLNGYPGFTPYACGSGESCALTAMKCGKNAIDAVKVACEMDIFSGGEVTYVVINPYDY